MVYAIITGQGGLPRALLEAASAIVPDVEGVSTLSNVECPVAELRNRLEQAIMSLPEGNVVVFADLLGSSCANAGAEVKRSHPHIAVLSGANLAMLVRFLYHRNKKPFVELIPFLVETGRTAVQAIETLEASGQSPAPESFSLAQAQTNHVVAPQTVDPQFRVIQSPPDCTASNPQPGSQSLKRITIPGRDLAQEPAVRLAEEQEVIAPEPPAPGSLAQGRSAPRWRQRSTFPPARCQGRHPKGRGRPSRFPDG